MLVVGLFVLATLVMTYPVAFVLGSRLPGWPGDVHEYVWKLWYVEHALVEQGQLPLFAPEIFHPYGLDLLRGTELTATATVLGLPLTMLFGAETSYTLQALASFVLTGLGVALIVRNLTGSWLAGAVAGLAFAFSDYRMQRLGGHLNLIQTQWPVLAFYFAERWLQSKSPRQAALAGAMVVLTAYATVQYLLALGLLLPAYTLVRGWPWLPRLRERRTLLGLAAGLAILVPVLALTLVYLDADASGLAGHTFAEIDSYSAWPADYVTPEPHHPAADLLLRLWPSLQLERTHSERTAYLGAVAFLLAGVGLAAFRRRRAAAAYAVVGFLAAGLALGPTLQGPSGRVYVQVPAPVAATLVQAGAADLVARTLSDELATNLREGRAFVPTPATPLVATGKLDDFRAWGRLAGFAAFAVAVLAGLGAAALLKALPRGRLAGPALAVFLGALVLVDQAWLPFPTFDYRPRAVDLWLAQQPGDFALAYFPVGAAYSGSSNYATTVHGKKIAYGYATFPPAPYRQKMDDLRTFPKPSALSLLASWDVKYVLVSPDAYGAQWREVEQEVAASPYLRPVVVMDGIRIYELLPARGGFR
mgnify:CR=1 FL=1